MCYKITDGHEISYVLYSHERKYTPFKSFSDIIADRCIGARHDYSNDFQAVHMFNLFPYHIDQAKPPIEDEAVELKHLFESLRYFTNTRRNAIEFVNCMNLIGWPEGGFFSTLLSMVGYHFCKRDGHIVTQKHAREVAPLLSLLIFEL